LTDIRTIHTCTSTVTRLVAEAANGITVRARDLVLDSSTQAAISVTCGICTVVRITFTVIISSRHTYTFTVTRLVVEAINGITERVDLHVLIFTRAEISLACADLTCNLSTDDGISNHACCRITRTWTTFIIIPIVETVITIVGILATGSRTCATTWPLFGYTGIFAATLAIRANLVIEAAWNGAFTGRAIFYVMGLTITSEAVTLAHGTWVFILYTLGRRNNAGAAVLISITTSTDTWET